MSDLDGLPVTSTACRTTHHACACVLAREARLTAALREIAGLTWEAGEGLHVAHRLQGVARRALGEGRGDE